MEIENKPFKSPLIYIDDYRFKKHIDNNHSIREFGDRYEYCFVKKYENIYADAEYDSIEIGSMFVQLVTVKRKSKIISIYFYKDIFSMEDMLMYLDFYGIKLLNEDENIITDVCEVLEVVKFRGMLIAFYEKGINTITINELIQVTDSFIVNKQKINVINSKEIDSVIPKSKIILNGNEINFIPEIEIDPITDLLISNGNIMVTSYIGEYFNTIGFYNKKGDALPVAWINNKETTIFIDVHESDGCKIVNVEHSYVINFDGLL